MEKRLVTTENGYQFEVTVEERDPSSPIVTLPLNWRIDPVPHLFDEEGIEMIRGIDG